VKLRAKVESAVVAHARRALPAECCGLLLGTPDAVLDSMPAANIADDPTRRYLVDPRDHLQAIRIARQRGLEVVGAYHSHPRSSAQPSATDAAQAFGEFLWIIVGFSGSSPDLRAWSWVEGNFVPVTLVRVPEGEG